MKITDRMKDIIITAGGKNIAPSEIENALKASPYIKEAIVIGDRRPYLTALIGIELDTVGRLGAAARHLAYTTYRDLVREDQRCVRSVQGIVDDVNARFATVEQIKKFGMLPKELDHEDGELTATQKVKRKAIGDDVRRPRRGHVPMTELVQSSDAAGSATARVYALLAFGFVIIYKSTRVISFAQPALMLAGAVLVTYLVATVGFYLARGCWPPLAVALLALGVERTVLRPMIGRPVFVIAIITLRRRHRDQGGRQRLHRPGRAAGRRPVGPVDVDSCSAIEVAAAAPGR